MRLVLQVLILIEVIFAFPFSVHNQHLLLRGDAANTHLQNLRANRVAQHGSKASILELSEAVSLPYIAVPLATSGRDIVDSNNERFQLASINWHGGSDEQFIPAGLDVQHRSIIAHAIRQLGFNSVRLPYSDEMVYKNPIIPPHALSANADIFEHVDEVRALDVYHSVVEALTDEGLAVIPSNYRTAASGYRSFNLCETAWYNDHLLGLCSITQSEESWITNLETIMARHISNPRVIGVDLRNDVRGSWGIVDWNKWAAAAELAGNRLLRMNTKWLIFVGGIQSSRNLEGVRTRPVKLVVSNRVVYEVHVDVAAKNWVWRGTAFQDYASFAERMRQRWAYLLLENLAPVWVGEFGISKQPKVHEQKQWSRMLTYLKDVNADWAYAALGRDAFKETWGLLASTWESAIIDFRMKDLLSIMPASS